MNDFEFEHELGAALHDLAGDVTAPAGYEASVARRARSRQRRPLVATAAGATLAVALTAIAVVPRLGDDKPAVVAAGPAPTDPAAAAATTSSTLGPGPSTSVAPAPPTTAPAATTIPAALTTTTTTPATPACGTTGYFTSTRASALLPTNVYNTSAVSDGRYGYVLGGAIGVTGGVTYTADVLRFDPATQAITKVAPLPAPLGATAAIWDGSAIYLFGGYNAQLHTDWNGIVRYEPATGRSEILAQTLPFAATDLAAIWDGHNVYLFGGNVLGAGGVTTPGDQIVRFTPATGAVTVLASKVPPAPKAVRAAVWDGQRVLILLGTVDISSDAGTMMAFDPASGAVSALPGTVQAYRFVDAVWSCRGLLVFGGDVADPRRVYTYSPTDGQTRLVSSIPQGQTHGALFSDGQVVWLLGGLVPIQGNVVEATTDIIRIAPT